jgi:uncharacterized protein (TIGR02246 family)
VSRPGPSERVTEWIERYRTAWESNDPEDIAALFTDDAEYIGHPGTAPVRGREAIIAMWLEDADPPGETAFEWRPTLEAEDRAIVECRTVYTHAKTYRNLWVIDFAPDGRATSFTEWYMDELDEGGDHVDAFG